MPKLNMVKALNLGLFQEMERDRDVLILGEDVGVDGGVFRVTDDLQRKFGSQRVIDSPLAAAIRDPDPVIFFEAKALYHASKEEVPEESETLPIGRAQVAREGSALTLIAYGAMVRVALEAADVLRDEDGVDAEVIDLLTISPLDRDALVTSVKKTGRAVVVHEAARSFGPGAEIAASIMDGAFLSLEAPVRRVAAYDVPFVGFPRAEANRPGVPRGVP